MVHVTDVKKITLMEQVADMKNSAKKGASAKSVFHEATYQTSIGQQYTKVRINPSSQSNNRIQLRTLLPQLHPQRLRDHPVVAFNPKRSSNMPPLSRNNQNAILHRWICWIAIQQKLRLTL